MQKILLHCCCGPCATQVIERLKDYFQLTLYFYNPCIFPGEEYEKRKESAKIVSDEYSLELIEGNHDYENWKKIVEGHENSEEGGRRCNICIRQRLEGTAAKAREMGMEFFGTTLTISPHKDAFSINQIGRHIAINSNVDFLMGDFKQNDGFKKSVKLSEDLGLYRQNYCGCEFSIN